MTHAHAHTHTDEQIPSCPECDDMFQFDPFGFGSLLDQHEDIEIDAEELTKRFANAMEMARQFGSGSSNGMEDELAELTKPKLNWQDFVRGVKLKRTREASKNNWSSPRRKPLFAGLYVPNKTSYMVKFLCAIDTSASMTNEAIAYGVSQLQILDDRGEGVICPWDTQAHWSKSVKVKNASKKELRKTNISGRGGTSIKHLFDTYQENVGQIDIMIIITDGELCDPGALNNVVIPKTMQVIWLVLDNNKFAPPFGRSFHLMND